MARREGVVAAIDVAPDATWVLDDAATVIAANAATRQLTGREPADTVGVRLPTLLSPDAGPSLEQRWPALGSDRSPRVERVTLPGDPEGQQPGLDATLRRLSEADGGVWVVSARHTATPAPVDIDVVGRDRILQGVAFAAERLLRGGDWEHDVAAVLERLGEATGVSRAYVFENARTPDGTVVTSYRFEWCSPGTPPQLHDPTLQGLPYAEAGYARWEEVLGAGRNLAGRVADFPASEHAVLEAQDIMSLVVVPIFVAGRWWGFMGFDECHVGRRWSDAEVGALRVAADVLGAALQQQRAREALLYSRHAYASAYQREREAVERLRALDELKDSFLEAVSHELRTPLASVMGLAETVHQHYERLPAEQLAALSGRIAGNARRLDRMLANLLDVSRLRRGIVEADRAWVDCGELVERVVKECDPLPGHELEITIEVERMYVDVAHVERILDNLLRNAIRHGPPDAPIRLAITATDATDVLLIVDDEGEGVPDAFKRTVFEPFERGPAVERHRPGTGIGLSLVARLAGLHGGRAWIEDRDGGGASVRVLLADARPATAMPSADLASP